MAIHIKTPEEIAGLRIAGRLASELLDYLTPFVKPGITTGELDKLAYDYTVNVHPRLPRLPARRHDAVSRHHLHLDQPRGLPRHSG